MGSERPIWNTPLTEKGRALAVDVANRNDGPLSYWDERVSAVERDARWQGVEAGSEALSLLHEKPCCEHESSEGWSPHCWACDPRSERLGFPVGASEQADPLDVERLGFDDLLDVGEAILRHYPDDTIVCSHHPEADPGALTTAAIADLIRTVRVARLGSPSRSGEP